MGLRRQFRIQITGSKDLILFFGHMDRRIAIQWLVHWLLMGGLLHLVQWGGAWVGCGPTQSPPHCAKCNSSPINGQCTLYQLRIFRCGTIIAFGVWRVNIVSMYLLLRMQRFTRWFTVGRVVCSLSAILMYLWMPPWIVSFQYHCISKWFIGIKYCSIKCWITQAQRNDKT